MVETETTVAPRQCAARSAGLQHCFHVSSAPIPGPGFVTFPNVCCFCAPTYIKLEVVVPHTFTQEQVVASQMQHGPIVVIMRQEKPQPGLAVPARPQIVRG